MNVRLWSISGALTLLCVLLYSAVEARPMGFDPNAVQPPQQPALRKTNEVRNIIGETLPSTLKVSVNGSLSHNHAHGIEDAETVARGTQVFNKRPTESKKDNARMKKDVGVMAFRPSSSGHSPGIGHDDPPGPVL